MKHLAAFIDLNSMRISAKMLEDILEKLSPEHELCSCKFYNYDNKRNRQFYPFIIEHNAETAVPLQSRKKVRVDMRFVIDAVRACSKDNIDAVLLITGEVDCLPLLTTLKSMGIYVIMAVEGETAINQHANQRILIERAVEVAKETKPLQAVAETPVKAANIAAETENTPLPQTKTEISDAVENQIKDIFEEIETPYAMEDWQTESTSSIKTVRTQTAQPQDIKIDEPVSLEAFKDTLTKEYLIDEELKAAFEEAHTENEAPSAKEETIPLVTANFGKAFADNEQLATEKLYDAIVNSNLAEQEKLLQEKNLKKIKAALMQLMRQQKAEDEPSSGSKAE